MRRVGLQLLRSVACSIIARVCHQIYPSTLVRLRRLTSMCPFLRSRRSDLAAVSISYPFNITPLPRTADAVRPRPTFYHPWQIAELQALHQSHWQIDHCCITCEARGCCQGFEWWLPVLEEAMVLAVMFQCASAAGAVLALFGRACDPQGAAPYLQDLLPCVHLSAACPCRLLV